MLETQVTTKRLPVASYFTSGESWPRMLVCRIGSGVQITVSDDSSIYRRKIVKSPSAAASCSESSVYHMSSFPFRTTTDGWPAPYPVGAWLLVTRGLIMTCGSSGTVRFDAFEADLRTGELRKDGIKVKLDGQPFQVLAALVERPGQLVTREELQKELWPDETFVDFEQGINAAVKRIRL